MELRNLWPRFLISKYLRKVTWKWKLYSLGAQYKIWVTRISMVKSEPVKEDFLFSAISKKCLPEDGIWLDLFNLFDCGVRDHIIDHFV